MENAMQIINRLVWGVPTVVLILGVGLYLSLRTGFVQLLFLPRSFRLLLRRITGKSASKNEVTPYQALCTALAATVGTGNLAGVAGAIALGGPGSVFWMWICAFLGMVTKYAEAVLSVRFHEKQPNGETLAGPMYVIHHGMGKHWNWLACVYSFFGVVASFGVGNATQVNAVISGINRVILFYGGNISNTGNLILGILLAALIAVILFGGTKRIGSIAEQLVPFASVFYLLLCFIVLAVRFSAIDDVLCLIVRGAFSPKAVSGGMIGSAFQSLRVGSARGVFTNEAGLGTAGIAHGAANVSHPVEQGMMGIVEVFLDTVIICTMTALVILCSGVSIPFGTDVGADLTVDAFSSIYGSWISVPIAISLCLFAIATILGWGLYGLRCAQFLFGIHVWKPFMWIQVCMVVLGAVLGTGTVWMMAETVNGLMAIPNLIALVLLCPELVKLTKDYRKLFGRNSAGGGTYENFNQCQSLRTFSNEKVSPSGGKGG